MLKNLRKQITILCMVGLLATLCLSPRAAEGYDPMLQISNQFAKPNVLIVLDVTGSMEYLQTSDTTVGIDTFGLPTFRWVVTVDRSYTRPTPVKGAACHWDWRGNPDRWNWTCAAQPAVTYTYTYTLTPTYREPCRIDVFKNALGNSVPLYNGNPVVWPGTWPTSYANFTYIGNGQWTRTVTTNAVSASTVCQASSPGSCTNNGPTQPANPFAIDSWTDPDYSTTPVTKATIWNLDLVQPSRLPQNLVGINASVVNWGLETFSSNATTVRVSVLADDTPSEQETNVSKIQAYLKASSISTTVGGVNISGLSVGGSTPASRALNTAKGSLQATYTSGGPGGVADPKASACGRIYAAILVTDGQSNDCNDPTYQTCDPPGTAWADYPEGRTSELWLEGADSSSNCTSTNRTTIPMRTFVIGVSSSVARCELNLEAYFGRTDASSPNGDAGMRIERDIDNNLYRLPPKVPANFKSYFPVYRAMTSLPTPLSTSATEDTANYRAPGALSTKCTGSYCKDYAYFANDPSALYDAFVSIIGALAAGDYTTAAPVASSTAATGTLAILPSTAYPKWKGHLYAFDLTKNPGTAGYLKWDAGYNLAFSQGTAENPYPANTAANPAYVSPADRKIYTWDPTNGNALVEVREGNLSTLNTACGSCGLTANDINFLKGYDGSSSTSTTLRPWILSSTINSTPAIVQSPEKFEQSTLESHAAFQNTYKNRTPLVWLCADDGMLHAFQLADGKEVLALIPPNLLSLQRAFRDNYDSVKAPTGQPGLPGNHIYGMASSPRYGDVYFSGDGTYKTLMVLTQGPGGNLVAGIDVTDPVGNIDAGTDPVTITWSKTGSDWAGLYKTWSTPALGASQSNVGGSPSVWTGISGAGFNAASTKASQVIPKALIFNPITGELNATQPTSPANVTSPTPLVGNQTFADSVIYSTTADAYYPDNIVNLALQADLNGRIWFIPGTAFTSCSVGIDATTKDGTTQQPIYYPPVANAFTDTSGNKFDIYAFGSGTVYEKSADVSGSDVGTTGHFTPSLYLVVKPQNGTAATTDQILRIPIKALYVPEDLTNHTSPPAAPTPCSLASNWERVGTYQQLLCRLNTHTLMGHRTQITAPPALFVPIAGAGGDPVVVFLLYDPDAPGECAGRSYILKVSFNADALVGASGKPKISETVAYDAGVGAASGFAVAGSRVILAKSAVGEGAQASVNTVPGLNPTAGMSSLEPVWWKELK